jgi:hypothetical protein
MRRLLPVLLLVIPAAASAQTPAATAAAKQATSVESALKYGANPAVGRTFWHDGVQLYYEVYGTSEPLLLVHGNGSSIGPTPRVILGFPAGLDPLTCGSGGTGRRASLRSLFPQGSGGSSPLFRTNTCTGSELTVSLSEAQAAGK